jgi:hypothetical protein
MQAPGDPEEDTEGGFRHGGWQRPYFDDVLGESADEGMASTDAFRAEDLREDGRFLADGAGRRPVRPAST